MQLRGCSFLFSFVALPPVPSTVAAAAISGQGVLGPTFMAGVAYMASAIPRLVCLEVIEALRPTRR